MWVCKPSAGRQRQADPERPLARQPSRNSKLRVRGRRRCLKGVSRSARLLIPSAVLRAPHAQAASCTHTLTCIQCMCAHTGEWGKNCSFHDFPGNAEFLRNADPIHASRLGSKLCRGSLKQVIERSAKAEQVLS